MSLPCGDCRICEKVHKQWSRFEEEVDDVVPLAVKPGVSTNNEPLILRNIEAIGETSDSDSSSSDDSSEDEFGESIQQIHE